MLDRFTIRRAVARPGSQRHCFCTVARFTAVDHGPGSRRLPFLYRLPLGVHRAVTGWFAMLGGMADLLVVVGIVVFVAAMLGLIWGLERV